VNLLGRDAAINARSIAATTLEVIADEWNQIAYLVRKLREF
jgi:hypothetical protein